VVAEAPGVRAGVLGVVCSEASCRGTTKVLEGFLSISIVSGESSRRLASEKDPRVGVLMSVSVIVLGVTVWVVAEVVPSSVAVPVPVRVEEAVPLLVLLPLILILEGFL